MQVNRFLATVVLSGFALVAGCGGGGSSSVAPPVGSSAVSLSFRDAAPSGTSVLSLEVTITSAMLQPGNIQLVNLANPPQFEFTQLQTEKAFVSTTRVSPGTYTLTLNFANPELTFQNTSTGAETFGNCVGVPPQGVCELKPATSSLTATVQNLNVGANGTTGLEVDLDLSKIIQPADFSLNFQAGLSVIQVSKPTENEELEELDDIVGRVTRVGSNQFDLQPLVGQPMTIKVDPNTTKFADFKNCPAVPNNFSCLAVNQIVEVDLSLPGGGPPFTAIKVELEDDVNQEDVEGMIVKVANPPTSFTMVVHDDQLSANANKVSVGNQVTVTIDATATFGIDKNGLNVPAGLSFASGLDLLPGQEVEVQVKPGTTISAGPPVSLTASRIALKRSQMTGQVQAPAGSSFTLTGLPSPFPASVQVDASQAKFENVSGVSGLKAGDTVSVKGLLFGPATSPKVVAQKVRKRP